MASSILFRAYRILVSEVSYGIWLLTVLAVTVTLQLWHLDRLLVSGVSGVLLVFRVSLSNNILCNFNLYMWAKLLSFGFGCLFGRLFLSFLLFTLREVSLDPELVLENDELIDQFIALGREEVLNACDFREVGMDPLRRQFKCLLSGLVAFFVILFVLQYVVVNHL